MSKNDKTSFLANLNVFGLGELLPTMEKYQEQIIQEVKRLGGSGELTVKIKYKLDGDKQVLVTPDISTKLPKKRMTSVPMFTTEDNKLALDDPAQMTIDDVEDVSGESQPPEDISEAPDNVVDINQAANGN